MSFFSIATPILTALLIASVALIQVDLRKRGVSRRSLGKLPIACLLTGNFFVSIGMAGNFATAVADVDALTFAALTFTYVTTFAIAMGSVIYVTMTLDRPFIPRVRNFWLAVVYQGVLGVAKVAVFINFLTG